MANRVWSRCLTSSWCWATALSYIGSGAVYPQVCGASVTGCPYLDIKNIQPVSSVWKAAQTRLKKVHNKQLSFYIKTQQVSARNKRTNTAINMIYLKNKLTLTIVDTNRSTRAAMCRRMIPSSSSSIFPHDLGSNEKRRETQWMSDRWDMGVSL